MSEPLNPAAPKRKVRLRDAPQVRLAALLTDHPPLRTIELAPDPALDLRTKLEFEPAGTSAVDPGRGAIHGSRKPAGATEKVPAKPAGGINASPTEKSAGGKDAAATVASFGLLHSNFLPRGLAFGRVPVKRGRWGSKPPESLQLLQPMSEETLALPALRLRGTVRAAGEALSDILKAGATRPPAGPGSAPAGASPAATAQAGPTTTQLWLAAELALHGWLATVDLRHFASERGEPYPLPGVKAQPSGKQDMSAALIEQDGLLLWRAWLTRQATRLAGLLSLTKARNPFRTELTALQAARRLELAEPASAGAILDELAHKYKLKSKPGPPQSYVLSGELAPPPPSAEDAAAARAILELFAADGTGPLLKDVREQHLSRQHVIAWLLDAGVMIELHAGMLILAARLNRCLAAFPLRPGRPGPSVRELKDQLDFGRREAEALRVWYLRQGAT